MANKTVNPINFGTIAGSEPAGAINKQEGFTGVTIVKNTTVEFTGSNHQHAAVIVGEENAAGTITLSDGNSINIAHLTLGTTYMLSPSKIVESGNKTVYVLKR